MAKCKEVLRIAEHRQPARRSFAFSVPKLALLIACSGLLLAACSAMGGNSNTQPEGGDLYRPPALSSPAAALPTPLTPSPPAPSPTPPLSLAPALTCTSSLRYIEDLTIPDGSIAAPGEALDKRWRVENSGTCNWDQNYLLKLIAGPGLGAGELKALYPARSGTQADLQIIFTAPQEPGAYRSAWQAHDPTGQPFGDPIFIDFVVLAQ